MDMTQEEIDIHEWKNPDNWSDGFFKVYFSKKDSRVFVPSRFFQRFRWSPHFVPKPSVINLGHRRGALWCGIFLLMICIVLLAAGLTVNFMEP
jgi:uncharacterized membrane protein